MGNRYADDIKRIVGIDPNQSSLDKKEPREAIGASRGVGWHNPITGQSEGGEDSPDEPIDTEDSPDNATDQKAIDPLDPNSGIHTETGGLVDVADLIDGIATQSTVNTPQITEAGLIYDNNSALTGISAVDCDTGDAVEIRFKNAFVPPDGLQATNGFQLTADWDDADVPPI